MDSDTLVRSNIRYVIWTITTLIALVIHVLALVVVFFMSAFTIGGLTVLTTMTHLGAHFNLYTVATISTLVGALFGIIIYRGITRDNDTNSNGR